jgi:predicted nucleic acid-binding protein
VELEWWIGAHIGVAAFATFLENVAEGVFEVVDLVDIDYLRVRDLMVQYADSDIGFVDAAVLAIVERLAESKLATIDHRHFRMLRPRHVEALQLLPEL